MKEHIPLTTASFVALLLISISSVASQRYNQCPPKLAWCKDNRGKGYFAYESQAPKCWFRLNNIWGCRDRSYNGGCSYQDTDITNCGGTPVVQCPSRDSYCQNNYGQYFRMSDYNAPPCWTQQDGGRWRCTGFSYSNNQCPNVPNTINIRSCTRPIPPPQDRCPARGTQCRGDNGQVYFSGDRNQLPCWQSTNYGWRCFNYQNNRCPEYTTININSCYQDHQTCPSRETYCLDRYGHSYKADDSNAPPCWAHYNGGWRCAGYSDSRGSCPTSPQSVKIRDCFRQPVSQCPRRGDSCRDRSGYTFYAGSQDALPCWERNSYGWTCSDYYNSRCPSQNMVNLVDCGFY